MKAKSSAHYQREFRKRLREQGLLKKEVWIHPENTQLLSRIERQLRDRPIVDADLSNLSVSTWIKGEQDMNVTNPIWTTQTLYRALKDSELFAEYRASVELIDGVEPSLHIVMFEYGDLPIFLTVAGDQIIAESVLWSADEVTDVHRFNETVLRTHKYFPLSTISLDAVSDDTDYYHMFGALSSASPLSTIIYEIEVLASNVLQATEAYGEFLNIALEA